MNGKSECCDAQTLRDDTGDIICRECGTIQEVITTKEDEEGEG